MKRISTLILSMIMIVSVSGQTPAQYHHPFAPLSAAARKQSVEQPRSQVAMPYQHKNIQPLRQSQPLQPQYAGWRLDSMIFMSYDDMTTTWYNSQKQAWQYDTNGWSVESNLYFYDDSSSAWVNEEKEEMTYYPSGLVMKRTSYSWDQMMNQWQGSYSSEFTYTTTALLDTLLSSGWDQMTSQWLPYSRSKHHYDAQSRIIRIDSDYWDEYALQWTTGYKEEYTYDTSGYLTEVLVSYWVDYLGQYLQGSKDEYTYNALGQKILRISSWYDMMYAQWTYTNKDEYGYNASGDRSWEIYYYYDEVMAKWVESSKYEYDYDASGNLFRSTSYSYDEILSQWVPDYMEEYLFNNAWPFNMLILPYDFTHEEADMFKHMLTHFNVYYHNGTIWSQNYKGELFYSPHNLIGVEEPKEISASLYPNPASSKLRVVTGKHTGPLTIELFDLQGRRLMQQQFMVSADLDVSQLGRGLCLYRISSLQQVVGSGKLVLQ